MQHFGDITKISGYEVPIVDCIIGGSPCQDLSVAGKRAGLEGERSGLFMEQIRIAKEMRERDARRGVPREFIRPRYMVWENVPGAFSSNKGEDFRIVLEEIIKIVEPEASVPMPEKNKWPYSGILLGDGWSVAWRVLDAQFWGTSDKPLPQRRRRIALVADFGAHSAPEILFVRKSVSGDSEPGKPKRKEAARDVGESVGGAVGCDIYNGTISGDKAVTLNANSGASANHAGPTVAVPYTLKIRSGCEGEGKGALIQTNKGATLSTLQDQTLFQPVLSIQGSMIGRADQNGPQGDGWNEDVCFTQNATGRHAVCYGIGSYHSNAWKSDNPDSGVYVAEICKTLDALNCGYPGCNQGGMAVVEPICIETTSTKNTIVKDGICPTLTARMGTGGNQVNAVLEAIAQKDIVLNDQGGSMISCCINGKAPTLRAEMHGHQPCVLQTYQQVTGPLMANSHPGSYTGQDAYNDMLVTQPIVLDRAFFNQGQNAQYDPQFYEDGVCPALIAKGPSAVQVKHIVRRLTPLECERLQGFPDNWTDIGEWVDSKGKKHKEADSPRYKALGNSIALPPWKWVLKRLCACYERDATMASLFDGIGGFPLIWEQLNGKGSCLWASEIEEFCVAVTKERFGD